MTRGALLHRWQGPGIVAVLLAVFWAGMWTATLGKSVTADEIVHVTAGYTYWRFDDYRLNPENGNLPQRWMALPFLTGRYPFPARDSAAWRGSDEWALGDQWFHQMGNSVEGMLARGRAFSALLAVALAALVWAYSRRLFGPAGGLLSLLACVLNPTILANGPLMTSDIAAALFFFAATMTAWDLLQRISPARLLACGAATAGLFLSKMSAALILPIGAILLAARLADGRPLPVVLGVRCREIAGRWRQAAALALAGVCVAGCVYAGIWAAFGFRFSAFADTEPGTHFNDTWPHLTDQPLLPDAIKQLELTTAQQAEIKRRVVAQGIPANKWTPEALAFLPSIEREVLTPAQARHLEHIVYGPPAGTLPRFLRFVHDHRLLPEAYVFGQVFSWKFSQKRGSFLNGRFGLFGWRWFFPYTVLLKTPLWFFAILGLAAAAAAWRWSSLYACLPLWTLAIVYGTALIESHINIGHRHFLATYPPMFVLAGAAARWTGRRAWMVAGLVAAQGIEMAAWFPDYLAYFNVLGGGPRNSYRHLVDSSLDWGQDLPGVNRYLADHHVTGPSYLSYFGTASPSYYRVPVRLMYSLNRPMQLFTVPVAGGDERIAGILRDHPDFDVAASGTAHGQQAVMLLERPAAFRLDPGTYFISATMLQPLEYDPPAPWGPWLPRYEREYQNLKIVARPFLEDDQSGRLAALKEGSVYDWMKVLNDYDQYRFARLTAYLRNRRPPDDAIGGGSILVYRLTAADLAAALDGPPVETGPDVLGELEREMGAEKIIKP